MKKNANKINESQLKQVITESIKSVLSENVLSGEINAPEYYVNKKAKEIAKYLDSVGSEFMEKYDTEGEKIYEYFASALWGFSERLEKIIQQYKEQ